MSRSDGDFCAHDNDNNNDNYNNTTDYFTPCACAWGNKINLDYNSKTL